MPRSLHYSEPRIINSAQITSKPSPQKLHLEIATGNQHKLKETQRLLPGFEVNAVNLDIDEIQGLDPLKVVSAKAKRAYELNRFNAILVEDTSLEIKALGGRPGTYVKDFCSTVAEREQIATQWLRDAKDRSVVARVILALYDGLEVHTWSGVTTGTVPKQLRGNLGFGWDDMFIPDGENRTFAEMSAAEKDKYSPRRKAIVSFRKNPSIQNHPILELPEPFAQELKRVSVSELQDSIAKRFAYQLECLEASNAPNKQLTAKNYSQIKVQENIYYTRYLHNENDHSLGLLLTDVDRKKLKLYKNGNPVLWQMGLERRHLALAQRVDFFLKHQNKQLKGVLKDLEYGNVVVGPRPNKRSAALESALGIDPDLPLDEDNPPQRAVSLKEIGYKKIASEREVSRTKSNLGLYNMVGKFPRSIFGVGSLPFISGWRDVIVMGALAYMPVFVHRNNINAVDFENQLKLIQSAQKAVKDLELGEETETRVLRNIGAAIGSSPKLDLIKAKKLYSEAGVKLFRIYTINSDPRVIETARALRQEFGEEVEIFVGQVVDKKQCLELIADDIAVDGLIFGHGGGRQCTSATNGMALSTLEELYSICTDERFNNTSILAEGGIGTYVGALLVLGVDCILRNAQFASCVIEQGDLYFEEAKTGKICQPYHGSASSPTMIIESQNPNKARNSLNRSGRTKNVEGKSGYIYYKERANSMSFYIDQFKDYAARTLADLGVESMWELREMLATQKSDLFRLVTPNAKYTSSAYKS